MGESILVVDDHADVRFFTGTVLRAEGYMVLEAGTAEEALAVARREQPRLVLLDAVLPDLSGLEVAAALADDPATADARVVMASSLVRSDDPGAAGRRGVHGYLHKPFRRQELIDCVRATLEAA